MKQMTEVFWGALHSDALSLGRNLERAALFDDPLPAFQVGFIQRAGTSHGR